MTWIQIVLIAGFVVAAVFAGAIFRTRILYRSLALALFALAAILVLFPDFTTVIAHALGVGRGADLLLYVALVAGVYVTLLLYLRIRILDRKIAELVRVIALRDARSPSGEQPAEDPDNEVIARS